jgi:hypothetical protein
MAEAWIGEHNSGGYEILRPAQIVHRHRSRAAQMRSQLFELRARPTMQRALPHLRDGGDVK